MDKLKNYFETKERGQKAATERLERTEEKAREHQKRIQILPTSQNILQAVEFVAITKKENLAGYFFGWADFLELIKTILEAEELKKIDSDNLIAEFLEKEKKFLSC